MVWQCIILQQSNRIEDNCMKTTHKLQTEQELNGNLTSQTSSLNKCFFKSISYSQGKHYKTPLLLPTQIGSLEKKMANKRSISNLNQAAKQQESDPIASWEIWPTFELESLPPNNLLFSLTRLQSCTNSCPGTFNFQWNFHKLCSPLSMNNKLPVASNEHWTKFVTFTVPINSSLELARFKPSQSLMMRSGTSKWPKTQQFRAIWHIFKVILQAILPIRKRIQMCWV